MKHPAPDPDVAILYEDDDVIVVDKPAGLVVHAVGSRDLSLNLARVLAVKVSDADSDRPGIVHRLDRDTSGVMIVARTATAKRFLQDQFKARWVEKVYIALVKGVVADDRFKIDLPLGPHHTHPTKRQVVASGKSATTELVVVRRYRDATLVEAHPLTGRTHQLRVHLAAIGHPIVGDRLYGTATTSLGRQFLHAASLDLELPSGHRQRFTSPLPKDLEEYLQTL